MQIMSNYSFLILFRFGRDTLNEGTTTLQEGSKSPRITSIKQIKALDKKQARLKADLTEEGTIHKDLTKDPGTKFVRNPSVPTKSNLHQSREDEKHDQALYFE